VKFDSHSGSTSTILIKVDARTTTITTIVGAGIIMDHEDTDHLGRALEMLTTITTPAPVHAQDLAPR
tara:strand:+ start:68005 stop:68205 length:201 start_codon:yes stop_codon:yes gene_type:complete